MVYISPGNRRMSLKTFSLPAEKTCPGATGLCKVNCYAKKAEVAWKNVLPSRKRNYKQSKKRKKFVKEMNNNIKNKGKYFRIHESGDFYNQKYLNKWFQICRDNPDVKFLAYTQMYKLDWSNMPDNMVRYWSIWPDTNNKYLPKNGLRAYVVDNGKGKIPKYKIEPKGKNCSKGMGSKVKCENCKYCLEGKGDVIFKIH